MVADAAMVIDLAAEIQQKIPNEFDIASVATKYPIMYNNSMNTVLKQVYDQKFYPMTHSLHSLIFNLTSIFAINFRN